MYWIYRCKWNETWSRRLMHGCVRGIQLLWMTKPIKTWNQHWCLSHLSYVLKSHYANTLYDRASAHVQNNNVPYLSASVWKCNCNTNNHNANPFIIEMFIASNVHEFQMHVTCIIIKFKSEMWHDVNDIAAACIVWIKTTATHIDKGFENSHVVDFCR